LQPATLPCEQVSLGRCALVVRYGGDRVELRHALGGHVAAFADLDERAAQVDDFAPACVVGVRRQAPLFVEVAALVHAG
jgi:hypothetical protein